MNRRCFNIVLASASSREAEPLLKAYMDSLNQAGKLPVNMKDERGAELWRRQVLSPWMYFFVKYDPVPVLRDVKCPVLALNGSRDLASFARKLGDHQERFGGWEKPERDREGITRVKSSFPDLRIGFTHFIRHDRGNFFARGFARDRGLDQGGKDFRSYRLSDLVISDLVI